MDYTIVIFQYYMGYMIHQKIDFCYIDYLKIPNFYIFRFKIINFKFRHITFINRILVKNKRENPYNSCKLNILFFL